ncbi:MAG: flap endonuclease-1 [Candidatus Aenigmarchaeota archaeon]|nr:flap endonuclease-1 [Candidatus Aenigmarchaeota archaeon]
MGVKISQIIPKEDIDVTKLSGKTIAVDALNTIYQFLSIIRQYDGSPLADEQGRTTSHLSGIFYRSLNQMIAGVRLVYVFDGKPPEFKSTVNNERTKKRAEAHEKWMNAKEKGNFEEAKKHAQASVKITDEIIKESKELLIAMGIPVVQAPSEGEAQAAVMARKGIVFAAASSDFDTLLFGTPRLIRNLNITGKRKIPGTSIYREVKPEIIHLEKALSTLGISREQLISLGILVGTDYNPGGIAGLGPKKALAFVKKHKKFDTIFENIEWNFNIQPKEICDFFMNPPTENDLDITQKEADPEKIKKILCEKHNFSDERVASMLKKLDILKEQKKQTTLGKWG